MRSGTVAVTSAGSRDVAPHHARRPALRSLRRATGATCRRLVRPRARSRSRHIRPPRSGWSRRPCLDVAPCTKLATPAAPASRARRSTVPLHFLLAVVDRRDLVGGTQMPQSDKQRAPIPAAPAGRRRSRTAGRTPATQRSPQADGGRCDRRSATGSAHNFPAAGRRQYTASTARNPGKPCHCSAAATTPSTRPSPNPT